MPMFNSAPRGGLSFPPRFAKALGFQSGERLVARVEDDQLVIEKPEVGGAPDPCAFPGIRGPQSRR